MFVCSFTIYIHIYIYIECNAGSDDRRVIQVGQWHDKPQGDLKLFMTLRPIPIRVAQWYQFVQWHGRPSQVVQWHGKPQCDLATRVV